MTRNFSIPYFELMEFNFFQSFLFCLICFEFVDSTFGLENFLILRKRVYIITVQKNDLIAIYLRFKKTRLQTIDLFNTKLKKVQVEKKIVLHIIIIICENIVSMTRKEKGKFPHEIRSLKTPRG